MNTKTRTALRATLKQEDAALAERLPELAPPPAAAQPAQPAARRVRGSSTRGPAAEPKPISTAARAPAAVAQPAEPSAPASPPAAPEEPRRERFTLGSGDWRRLKTLRQDLGEAGYRPSRSELVRAALVALGARDNAEVLALVRALAPLADEDAAAKPARSRKQASGKAARKHPGAKKARAKDTAASDKRKAHGRKR